jgi:hypothetical protein
MHTTQNEENPTGGFQNFKNRYVLLPEDAVRLLENLATKQGITLEEAIRRAAATENHLYEAREKKAMVLLRYPDGEIKEVIFRTLV